MNQWSEQVFYTGMRTEHANSVLFTFTFDKPFEAKEIMLIFETDPATGYVYSIPTYPCGVKMRFDFAITPSSTLVKGNGPSADCADTELVYEKYQVGTSDNIFTYDPVLNQMLVKHPVVDEFVIAAVASDGVSDPIKVSVVEVTFTGKPPD